MDGEQVIEKILSEANGEAEKIKKQADERDRAEQAKLDEHLAQYKKQTAVSAKKAGAERKAHLLAGARIDIAKELLAEKRKILDEIFDKAKTRLKTMDDQDYSSLMTALMLKAVETGDEEVIIDTNETRINQKFIKQINRELGPGYKGNLRLSNKKQDLGAGFVLKRGKIKNNASLKILLAQAYNDLEIELAQELFVN